MIIRNRAKFIGPATTVRVLILAWTFLAFTPVSAQIRIVGGTCNAGFSRSAADGSVIFSLVGESLYGMTSGAGFTMKSGVALSSEFGGIISGSTDFNSSMPSEFALLQNYPNPFNPSTQIPYALPQRSRVELEVFNILGQKIATLLETELEPGYYRQMFDGSGYSSGVYFYRIVAVPVAQGNRDQLTAVRRFVIIK